MLCELVLKHRKLMITGLSTLAKDLSALDSLMLPRSLA